MLPGDLPRSRIEQRARERQESRQHHARLDRVPLVEFDPREGPGDGGRHRVALADAGATVVHDLLVERRRTTRRHVDVDRLRAKRREHPADERGGEESQ